MLNILSRLVRIGWLLALSACSFNHGDPRLQLVEKAYVARMAAVPLTVTGQSTAVLVDISQDLRSSRQVIHIERSAVNELYRVLAPGRVLGYIDPQADYMILCDGGCVSEVPQQSTVQPRQAAAPSGHPLARLEQLLGEPIVSMRRAPLSALYEVLLASHRIVYVDQQFKHVFWGHLLDLHSGEDLTDTRYNQLGRIDWQQLPLTDAIRQVRGDGSRHLVIFIDPGCEVCQAFIQQSLQSVTNATIYFYLNPTDASGQQIAQQILCSADPAASLNDMAHLRAGAQAASTCPNPIERNQALAKQLMIDTQPTLIFSNGRVVSFSGLTRNLIEFMPGLLESWLDAP